MCFGSEASVQPATRILLGRKGVLEAKVKTFLFKKYPVKRLLPKVRIYAYAQKNTDMRIKIRITYTYKILTLIGLFYIAFYRTCVYTHAYFRMRFFTLDKE